MRDSRVSQGWLFAATGSTLLIAHNQVACVTGAASARPRGNASDIAARWDATASQPNDGVRSQLPDALRAAYTKSRQAEGRTDPRFHVQSGGSGVLVLSSFNGLTATVDKAGIGLSATGMAGRLETRGVRCGTQAIMAAGGELAVDLTQPHRAVRTISATATEWYINGPLGIEHGYDVDPAGCDEILTVELATPGMVASLVAGDVWLSSHEGATALRYAGLFAIDAADA